jgi:outer membrane protein assembly factor BamB
VSDHTDCDDARADVFQGAPEVCDGVDDNCNGKVDEVGSIQYWVDADGDGWGDPASWAWLCGPTAGYANNDYDCDDAEPLAHTGAGEVCDGVDNDCDGSVDEGVALTWYPDADGDGWGDELLPTSGCSAPSSGVVFVGRDCDDARDDVNPEGEEVCDFVDQDCDGLVDEGSSNTWWTDADGDGYGDPAGMVVGCVIPPDASLDPTDCDDGDPSAHPGGVEVCDGVDQNCDGVADEGLASLFFADGDGDGVGSLDAPFQRACTAPVGMVDVAGDCDDGDPLISGCAATLTTEWTTFGADAGRTGYVPGYVAGGALAAGWSYTDVGRTVLPPVIAGGDLVLTGNGSTDAVTALDRVTGAQDWQYTLVSGTYPTGPSVGDGVVVVQRMDSSNSYLVGLDQAAGTQLWRTPVNNALDPYAAPLIFDGRAYAGAGVGLLYAIDDAVGTLTWTASLPYVDTWTPVGFGGQVYAQVADRLRSFDRATGAAKLDVALPAGPLVPGTMGGVPAIADGVALLVAGDDLVAVDVPAGTIRWTVADGFSGSPTVAHGLGYAIRDGDVTQVDLADGYVFRDFVGDGALVGKPVLTDDVVIASSATNTFVWTLWDGVVVDSIASGGSLVVGDGTLALTSGSTVQTYTW